MSSVFDDLIDQEAVIATLKEAIAASKNYSKNSQGMTHAWLFTGPPGSGRSNAAIAFAAALLCEKGGCNVCTNCLTVKDGSHADIELIRTEGLSIKVDEVRELITRTSWLPSVGNYRVVVIEDADRLTESAANALLKVIEEPGARTVWLLCASTLTDVIPTIRSRCRHLTLKTPSIEAVKKLLIERDGVDPKMADFAASAAKGHIGRAKYLAMSEEARNTREEVLGISSTIKNLASAFDAASKFLELAKANSISNLEEKHNDELNNLKNNYGTIGSKLALGGQKAVKAMETAQKNEIQRFLKDFLVLHLLDFYNTQNSPLSFFNTNLNQYKLKIIDSLLETNVNPILQLEGFFCNFLINQSNYQ